MEKKICIVCGKEFEKKKSERGKRWINKKCCSQTCQLQSIRGLNKGKMSEAGKLKITKNLSSYINNEIEIQKKIRSEKISKTRIKRQCPNNQLGLVGILSTKWKGEGANYNSKHRWIHKHWMKTGVCEECGITPIPNKKTRLKYFTHWHNLSGNYTRDRSDWRELCPKCHLKIHKETTSL